MVASKYVVQTILTEELYNRVADAADRMDALFPSHRVSRSTIVRSCVEKAISQVALEIAMIELQRVDPGPPMVPEAAVSKRILDSKKATGSLKTSRSKKPSRRGT